MATTKGGTQARFGSLRPMAADRRSAASHIWRAEYGAKPKRSASGKVAFIKNMLSGAASTFDAMCVGEGLTCPERLIPIGVDTAQERWIHD